jgi:AcrR family transcriptional regulator
MFKSARTAREATEKGDSTRERLLGLALGLFQERGFEKTTMRDLAKAAQVSLGAAYYYFPSKEALVHAFYDDAQAAHRERVEAACRSSQDLAERVRAALVTKLDVVADHRALLGALFRFAGDAGHPLSVFGEQTREQREAALSIFELVLEPCSLTPELRSAATRGLWLIHLGLLLYFIHDRSPEQRCTRKLATSVAQSFATGVRFAALPGAGAMLKPLLESFAEAGLISAQTTEEIP